MDFDGGEIDCGDGIAEGYAGMGVGAWVDHQRIEASQGVLDRIDQDPLVIRLDDFEFYVVLGGELFEAVVDLLKGHRTIDFRLAPTQQVKVRAMQHQNTWHRRRSEEHTSEL